jgi:hypothetical protein
MRNIPHDPKKYMNATNHHCGEKNAYFIEWATPVAWW